MDPEDFGANNNLVSTIKHVNPTMETCGRVLSCELGVGLILYLPCHLYGNRIRSLPRFGYGLPSGQ